MKLDFFCDLKSNSLIKEFIEELSNYLENTNKQKGELIMNEFNNEQNKYREENCLYQVVDFSANGVFLKNTNNNVIFEETNLPKELLGKLGNDYILRYVNGKYLYDEKLTDKFFNKLVSISEYKKIQDEFMQNSNILQNSTDTKYSVELQEDEYTILKYGQNNMLKVPNALVPFFIDNKSVLYYEDGAFKKVNNW